jgi:hypothetical protein
VVSFFFVEKNFIYNITTQNRAEEDNNFTSHSTNVKQVYYTTKTLTWHKASVSVSMRLTGILQYSMVNADAAIFAVSRITRINTIFQNI